MTKTLLFSVVDQIAKITFNRPTAMNSFNEQMADELQILTAQVSEDPSIRAVLLNGTGPLFMAGGDLHFFHEKLDRLPEGVMKIIRTLNASITTLMQMPKPVLASVHGSVAGVGISLMLAADLIIAAENTKFTLAYSGIGASPDGGVTFNLPRAVGAKKAMEWLLLSDLFDAKTAQLYGLVNWAVPADQLETATEKLLQRLVQGPTQSYMRIKRLLNETWQCNLENQLERESIAFEDCSSTTDFKTGVTEFLMKKKPAFVGR